MRRFPEGMDRPASPLAIRNSPFAIPLRPGPERRALLLAFGVGAAVGAVVSLLGVLGGAANALGWVAVVMFVLLALAYGYFWFAGERDAARPQPSF